MSRRICEARILVSLLLLSTMATVLFSTHIRSIINIDEVLKFSSAGNKPPENSQGRKRYSFPFVAESLQWLLPVDGAAGRYSKVHRTEATE